MTDFDIRVQIQILAEQLKVQDIDRQFVAVHAQYLADLTSDRDLGPAFMTSQDILAALQGRCAA